MASTHIKIDPPSGGLFRVARRVDPNDTTIDAPQWGVGPGWGVMSACPLSAFFPACDTPIYDALELAAAPDDPSKCDPPNVESFYFQPFHIYEKLGCVRGRIGTDLIRSALSDHVDVDLEGMVTLALELGYGVLGLAQAATLIDGTPPGTATPLVDGISHLLQQWTQSPKFASMPTFHIPMRFAPALAQANLIQPDTRGGLTFAGGVAKLSLGPYGRGDFGRTPIPNGTPGSTKTAAGADIAANEGWIYVSGPIEYSINELDSELSGLVKSTTSQELLTNSVHAMDERQAIYRFDPCTVLALKVVA